MLFAFLLIFAVLLDRHRDAGLVRRALDGQPGELEALCRRLLPIIGARVRRAFVARYAGRQRTSAEVEDVVQDVWLTLLKDNGRQLKSFDPDRGGSLEGYVGAVAEREVGNYLQKRDAQMRGGGQRSVDVDDVIESLPGGTGAAEVEAELHATQLAQHIDQALSERGRLVFRYVFGDGRAPDEVAVILGVERQVIYNWMHQIRKVAAAFFEAA